MDSKPTYIFQRNHIKNSFLCLYLIHQPWAFSLIHSQVSGVVPIKLKFSAKSLTFSALRYFFFNGNQSIDCTLLIGWLVSLRCVKCGYFTWFLGGAFFVGRTVSTDFWASFPCICRDCVFSTRIFSPRGWVSVFFCAV